MFLVRASGSKPLQMMDNFTRSATGVEIPMDIKNHFYIRNWAVSSFEKWGLNGNADGFRHAVLKQDHPTFDGAWVCLNHKADSSRDSIGKVMAPVYTDDQYVETILAVDRKLAEKRHPFLEKDIREGRINETSMGCVAQYSICSICGHKTASEDDYCEHLREDKMGFSGKGSQFWVGDKKVIAGELYENVIFVEDSILTDEPAADINAKIFDIAAAKGRGTTHSRIAGRDNLYYAIKATIKERGGSEYLEKLLSSIDELS